MWLGRLPPDAVLIWGIVVAVAAIASVFAMRGPSLNDGREFWRWLPVLAPPACLGMALLCFGGSAHPLAQYNDADAMIWAHLWFLSWIPQLVVLVLGVVASLVHTVKGAQRWPARVAWLVIAGAGAFSLLQAFANFPSA